MEKSDEVFHRFFLLSLPNYVNMTIIEQVQRDKCWRCYSFGDQKFYNNINFSSFSFLTFVIIALFNTFFAGYVLTSKFALLYISI